MLRPALAGITRGASVEASSRAERQGKSEAEGRRGGRGVGPIL